MIALETRSQVTSARTSPEKNGYMADAIEEKYNTSAKNIIKSSMTLEPNNYVQKIVSLEKEKEQLKREYEKMKRKLQEYENKETLTMEKTQADVEELISDYDTTDMHFFPRDIAGHDTSVVDCIVYAIEKDVEHFEKGFRRKAISLKKLISSHVLMNDDLIKSLNLKGKTPEHFCDMFEYTNNAKLLDEESLKIISEHFKIGIVVIRKNNTQYKYETTGGKYTRVVYLKEEDGRYSIIVGNNTKNLTREGDLRMFSRFDMQVKEKIMKSFEDVKNQIQNDLFSF